MDLTKIDNIKNKVNDAKKKYNDVSSTINKASDITQKARDLTGGENILSRQTNGFVNNSPLKNIPIVNDVAKGLASLGDVVLNIFGYDPGLSDAELQALKQKYLNETLSQLRAKANGAGIQLYVPNHGVIRLVNGQPPQRSYKMTPSQIKSAQAIKQALNSDRIKQIQTWYQEYSTGFGTLAYRYKSGVNKGKLIPNSQAVIDRWGYHMFGYPGHEFPLSIRLKYFKKFLHKKGIINNKEVQLYIKDYERYIRSRE